MTDEQARVFGEITSALVAAEKNRATLLDWLWTLLTEPYGNNKRKVLEIAADLESNIAAVRKAVETFPSG